VGHSKSDAALSVIYDAVSDAEGRFVFHRVFPGRVQISRSIAVRPMISRLADSIQIEVRSGQTTFTAIGKGGRRVTGRLILSDEMRADRSDHIDLFLQPEEAEPEWPSYPDFEMPEDYFVMTLQERRQWQEELMQKPEVQQYLAVLERARQKMEDSMPAFSTNVTVSPDGTFWADNVPAGGYVLSGNIFDPESRKQSEEGHQSLLGTVQLKLTVPAAINEADYEKPVDIGNVPVRAVFSVRLEQPVPDLEWKDLKNRWAFLKDFRGRYLLVDFGMLAESDNPKEIVERLKSVSEKFGQTGRFEILSLFSNVRIAADSLQRALEYLQKQQSITWTLGTFRLDSPAFSTMRYSSLFLVDPQGRLAALDIPLDRLEETLAHYLPAEPANP